MNDKIVGLTSREAEVGKLVANGLSNKEIATVLGVGLRTVETHRERIIKKVRRVTKIKTLNSALFTRWAVANRLVENIFPPTSPLS